MKRFVTVLLITLFIPVICFAQMTRPAVIDDGTPKLYGPAVTMWSYKNQRYKTNWQYLAKIKGNYETIMFTTYTKIEGKPFVQLYGNTKWLPFEKVQPLIVKELEYAYEGTPIETWVHFDN
jgi:hypothetical protein